ncbi:MAG: family 43 glycosylhydrolase [Clostridia bacterium]|nr:family 43 glycosylhydrolase [Clostridia bacterium]
MENRYYIRVFVRRPDPDTYPDGLARSIHMACRAEGGEETLLNHDYGILFATGLIDGQDRISPRSLISPAIRPEENGMWLVFAKRCYENGLPEDNADRVQAWRTADFCDFEPLGMITRPAGMWPDTAEISREIYDRVAQRWSDPCGYPFRVERELPADLPYPLVKGYGDPVLLYRDGMYYFIATNDNLNDIGLYVRSGSTMEALFRPDTAEHLILGADEEKGFVQTFWAPEFHEIGGELYILFAVSGTAWGPRCHMMKLKPGGDITDPDGWTTPVPVLRKDGSPLTDPEGITLDMTCFRTDRTYVVWSYRKHIGTPADTGSMLYIAALNETDPRYLDSEPVLLSRPLYGWENVAGTINNEGPYPIVRNGKVYLAYSGGSANGYTYVIGLLTADAADDLLEPANWRKSDTPFMNFTSVPGEYGPGHNSFFRDAEGEWWIAYHTVASFRDHLRCPVMHRLRFED